MNNNCNLFFDLLWMERKNGPKIIPEEERFKPEMFLEKGFKSKSQNKNIKGGE